MGMMSFEELKGAVKAGEVDTVLACLVDMQGRLMGKRFHAVHFIESAHKETHCCDYLLATDFEMNTIDGFKSASWEKGYGDYVMKPDLSTLRPVPWLEGTALVLCDVPSHVDHQNISHAPRAMLEKQVERAAALHCTPMMATELEFFIFKGTYEENRANQFRSISPISDYNEDYHILQTMKEESVMRPLRNHLFKAGVPVENSKGEAAPGQEELNIKYGPAMDCADYHTLAKHAAKEIAWQTGHSVSFMSKWSASETGSAAHIHQSMQSKGKNVFYDPSQAHGMSTMMRQYLAGLIKYAPEYTFFLAPSLNSYKRFVKNAFAPTSVAWSLDNRTAGFRICDVGGPAVRIECRIGGADLNPYLALAAQLAAGLSGIEEELELGDAIEGNHYQSGEIEQVPSTLRDAIAQLRGSSMLRAVFGDEVVEHYARLGEWEQEKFDRAITDYELKLGFEQA